jgi:hypothetical protein
MLARRPGARGGERDEEIARPRARDASHPPDAERNSAGDAAELVWQQRRVGGDDRDDGPLGSVISCPTGTPAIRSSRRWPKLHCTSTPTMYPPAGSGSFRLAVPMPPLKPRQIIPVPPPTLPSGTGPGAALSRARKTCALVTWKP